MRQIFYSPIPYVWLASVCLGFALLSRFPLQRRPIAAVLRDEDGASYTLPLVILTPLYTLLVCFVIECTLLLVVKIGVTQAAFAAARSSSVWLTAEPVGQTSQDELAGMVHLAAVNSMAPFGSSLDAHRVDVSPPQFAREFHSVYQTFVGPDRKQSNQYTEQKWNSAYAGTELTFDPPLRELLRHEGRDHDEPIEVTVTYEMPFNISAIGFFLGSSSQLPGANFYSRKISSSFELQLERPQSDNRRLGLEYDSFAANHTYRPKETN